MQTSEWHQTGVMHLSQVIPHRLLRQLRQDLHQILSQNLSIPTRVGIDRLAVALHHHQTGHLETLQRRFTELPSLYTLALDPQLGDMLRRCAKWPEASLSPILNLRAKLPWILNQSAFTTVPWHQDYGASDPCCDPVELITAWIPLTAAGAHQGGLEVIPKSHQLGWLPHHRGDRGPEVEPQALQNALQTHPQLVPVQIEARPGDLVLFHQLTLHRSLPNRSSRCRWSLDLRYASNGCSSGRPGLWSRDPQVGEGYSPAVAQLVSERYQALSDPDTRIHKRVDQPT